MWCSNICPDHPQCRGKWKVLLSQVGHQDKDCVTLERPDLPVVSRLNALCTPLDLLGCGITKHAFMKELSAAYEAKTGVKIAIEGGGATRGIHDAHNMESDADMGGTCRFLTAEENDTIQGVQFLPIAWDALVIIVHKNNPVENVTMDQLRALRTYAVESARLRASGHHGHFPYPC